YRRLEAYDGNVGRQGPSLRQIRIHTGRVRHVERAIVSPDTQDSLQIGEGVLREKVCALPNGLLRRVRDCLGAGKVEIRNREGMVRVVNIGRIIAHEVRRSRCQGVGQTKGGPGLMANNLTYSGIAPNIDPRG